MVKIEFSPLFEKIIKKIKDESLKIKIKKQVRKIIDDPETEKPMKYTRKGTREVYVPPFRLSYAFIKKEEKLIFLNLYHKDKQ